MRTLLVTALVACLLTTSVSRADLLVYEPFDYPSTPPDSIAGLGKQLNGLSGPTEQGFAPGSVWTNVGLNESFAIIRHDLPVSLNYPAGTFSVGTLGNKLDANGVGGAQRAFTRQYAPEIQIGDSNGPSEAWISMLYQNRTDGGFGGLRLSTSGDADIQMGHGNTGVSRQYTFNGFAAGGPTSGVDIVLGETKLLVARIQFTGDANADRMTLWIDPSGEAAPLDADAVSDFSSFNLGDFTQFGLQWNHAAFVDEIRIGETFADVAGIEASSRMVIPEPTSLALLGLGAGVLAVRRRAS